MIAAPQKVAFYTLGCKTNQYDTEAMQEEFKLAIKLWVLRKYPMSMW